MADPLSITASIISVLQLASCAGGYLRDVKNASKECKSLMLELSNTRGILETLKDTLAEIQEVENWSATLKMLGQRGGTLRQLETVLQDLNTRLSKTASAPGFKKLTKSLIWPFDKVKTEDVIKLIERQKSLLVLALDNDHIRLSESIKEDTIGIRHELTKVQEEVQVAVGGIQKLESREKDKSFQRLISALSRMDFEVSQNDIFERLEPHTGTWFLESDEFRSWLNGATQILFCTGIPGAGKTSLASLAINHVQHMIPPDGVNYGVAWVYFNHKEKTSQTTTALICSLAQQLIRGLSRIPDAIQDIFQRLLDVKTSLSLLESRRAFHAALASFNRAFIVVDALDECDEDRTRASFLSELRPVLSRIQLMVTSRHVASIEQDFQDALRIDVLAHRQDLDRYISSRLKSEKRLNQHVQGDTKLEKLIKDTLIEKSQGMFLMAKLHMDTLAKKAKRSKRAVRDAVNELPKELDDTYREAIRRIKGQDEDDVALAEQVLAWVCLCYEQVNVPQLQQALATQQGYSYDDQESLIDPDDFISVCAGLVAVDKERQVVRLVHYTAESFFERELLHHFPRARSQISLTCIAHLLDMRINSMAWDNTSSYSPFLERYYYHEIEQGIESAKEKGFGYNTFARYAINYAIQHIQANPDSALLESTQRFWRSENIVDIRKAYTYLHRKAGKICLLDCYPVLTELQLVVFFGFSSEINRLVAAGVVSDKGSVGTAVCIAADRGNSSILNLLLASGAPADGCIEMYPEEFWTALECAVDQTHLATVQILLQNLEITSTLPGNKLQTALHLAAKSLWPTGVKILLEHGAEANSTTFERQTPLHWAMMKYTPQNQGNLIEVIHLLLGAGTDVNARDVYGKSPLSYIQGTDIKVSRFLRGRGAIDMPDSQIIQNIRMGIIPKVRELLSMGVDVNTLCYEFGFPTGMNALQVTLVESPEPKLIQILLEAGANPDQHGPDGNALYIAVKLRRDPYRIIKPILDKIRNIDATFNDETALYLAAEHGFVHTVQVLLDGGASPEVDCGKYGSALAVTSRNFHSPVTKLLLQWGATVDRRVIKALNELRTDYYASWEQHISYSPYANIFDLLRQHASVEYSAKLQQLWEDVSNYLPARMINESSRFNY